MWKTVGVGNRWVHVDEREREWCIAALIASGGAVSNGDRRATVEHANPCRMYKKSPNRWLGTAGERRSYVQDFRLCFELVRG